MGMQAGRKAGLRGPGRPRRAGMADPARHDGRERWFRRAC
ncbi:hypothetical protein CC56_2813 [Bordetella pertussis H934]|nr:hypothetical protein CC56_2813 [Bordetella pertussis H934]